MKKLILFLVITLEVLSCEKKENTLTNIRRPDIDQQYIADSIYYSPIREYKIVPLKKSTSKIKYTSLLEEVSKKRKEGAIKMLTPDELKKDLDYAKSRRGGHIVITTKGLTMATANPGNYSVVIKDAENKEIYRDYLKSSGVNYDNLDRKYWGLDIVYLEERINFPITIYVIDQINSIREEFKITALK